MARAWKLRPDMFLSFLEAQHLLEHLRHQTHRSGHRNEDASRLDELIIQALLLSGLRNSEFCALTVGNTIVGRGESAFVVPERAGRGRTVYVPQHVSDLVSSYAAETRPRFLPKGLNPDDLSQPLIFNEHRRPYERSGLYRRVVKVLGDAGLEARASVQLLRHTYGYLAYLRTGGNLLFVQRQLGHAHPRITSIYADFVEESYPEMAECVAAGMEPATPVAPQPAPCRPEFRAEID